MTFKKLSIAVSFALLAGCAAPAPKSVALPPASAPITNIEEPAAPVVRDPVVVTFPSSGNVFRPSADQISALLPAALTAARVDIRARNDSITSGSAASDDAIAMSRGLAAKTFLLHKGVPESIIFIDAKGQGDYAADNKTAAGRAANRRVEIRITEKAPKS